MKHRFGASRVSHLDGSEGQAPNSQIPTVLNSYRTWNAATWVWQDIRLDLGYSKVKCSKRRFKLMGSDKGLRLAICMRVKGWCLDWDCFLYLQSYISVYNRMRKHPEWLCRMRNGFRGQWLWCSVGLQVFSHERTLSVLYLDCNQLTDLPRPLFHCHGLEHLHLSDNEIGQLPHALSSLINLKVTFSPAMPSRNS